MRLSRGQAGSPGPWQRERERGTGDRGAAGGSSRGTGLAGLFTSRPPIAVERHALAGARRLIVHFDPDGDSLARSIEAVTAP